MLLKNIMSNYLNESTNNVLSVEKKPIDVKSVSWTVEDKKLKKLFKFENRKHKEYFILEILKYLRETEVDLEFRVREKNVLIAIHAYSPYISEIETEASKDIDKIKKDVMYYYAEKN